MDLITSSLILGSVWCVYTVGNKIYECCVNIKDSFYDWDKVRNDLKLVNYKLLFRDKFDFGYYFTVEILPGGSVSELEEHKEQLQKIFKGNITIRDIPMSNHCEMCVVNKYVGDLKYDPINLPPTQLLIGYNEFGQPIIVDMLISPHIGVCGLSNNGKSKCIELAVINIRGADIHLVNCMDKDYVGIEAKRINGNDEIMEYLKEMSEEKERREKPLYIVIDEYNVLSRLRGVDKAIQDLLSQARHRNTFVICLMQLGQKEDVKFKNLFNCRLAFRCIEESGLRAFLGCSIEDCNLKQREFYLLHTELVKGKTYLL